MAPVDVWPRLHSADHESHRCSSGKVARAEWLLLVGFCSPCTVPLSCNLLSVLQICELQSATYHAIQNLWPETCHEWFKERFCFKEDTFAEAGTEGQSGHTAAAADMSQVEAALGSFLSEVAISSTMYRMSYWRPAWNCCLPE